MPFTTTSIRSTSSREASWPNSGTKWRTNRRQTAHLILKRPKNSSKCTKDSLRRDRAPLPKTKAKLSTTSLPLLSIRTSSWSSWMAQRKVHWSSRRMLTMFWERVSKLYRRDWRTARFRSHWVWWRSTPPHERFEAVKCRKSKPNCSKSTTNLNWSENIPYQTKPNLYPFVKSSVNVTTIRIKHTSKYSSI